MSTILTFVVLHIVDTVAALPFAIPSSLGVQEYRSSSSTQDHVQPLRAWYAIAQSCLVTIIACIWTSAHPNIDGPMDSWWTCTKRRIVTMLCAFAAPEVVLYWAFHQRIRARQIAAKYNKNFAQNHCDKSHSQWNRLTSLFRPLTREATKRYEGQPWTVTHGFFVQMGGFLLYDRGYPLAVLDYERLEQLIYSGSIDKPSVTERELQDRSKGNAISKSIVVLQTSWFALQCCVRWSQHLPVGELEAMTLAFAILNGVIYAFWWNKPQGVGEPVCLHLKKPLDDPQAPFVHTPSSSLTAIMGDNTRVVVEQHIPLIIAQKEGRNLEPHAVEDSTPTHADNAPEPLNRLPHKFAALLFRPILKMLNSESNQLGDYDLRVPMFYASKTDQGLAGLVGIVVGTTFGAVHLLALMSEFNSHIEWLLWLICSSILTVTPISVFMTIHLGELIDGFKGQSRLLLIFKVVWKLEYTIMAVCYVSSRFVVIALALRGIQRPPPGELFDTSWTSYIPHI